MCRVRLTGLLLCFCCWLCAAERTKLEHGILIPGAIKAFAERNLTQQELSEVLKARKKAGGSSRFVEQEVSLRVQQNRVKYKIDQLFGNATLQNPEDAKHFGLAISEWNRLRKEERKRIAVKVRRHVEQELQAWKKVKGLQDAQVYKEGSGSYFLVNKENKKTLKQKLGNCVICLKKMKIGTAVETTNCEQPHVFHEACARNWVYAQEKQMGTSFCPLCRKKPFCFERVLVKSVRSVSPYSLAEQCIRIR